MKARKIKKKNNNNNLFKNIYFNATDGALVEAIVSSFTHWVEKTPGLIELTCSIIKCGLLSVASQLTVDITAKR